MDAKTNIDLIIVTGGPGMGKTSIIEHLESLGYPCIPESGRSIIRHQLEVGGINLPWEDREGYADEMFRQAVLDYQSAASSGLLTFFDRGIADTIGYLRLCGLPVPAAMHEAAERYRYFCKVFIAPPWEAIYHGDDERKQSFAEAVATYEVMVDTYGKLGYELVELPKLAIEERAKFMIDSLSVAGH